MKTQYHVLLASGVTTEGTAHKDIALYVAEWAEKECFSKPVAIITVTPRMTYNDLMHIFETNIKTA